MCVFVFVYVKVCVCIRTCVCVHLCLRVCVCEVSGSSVVHCAALNYRSWRLEIPWMGVGRIMVGGVCP